MSVPFHLLSRNGKRKRVQKEKKCYDENDENSHKGHEVTKRKVLAERSTNISTSSSQSSGLFLGSKKSSRSSYISGKENISFITLENLQEQKNSLISDLSCSKMDNELIENVPHDTVAVTSCEDCDSYVASNEESKEDEVGVYSVQSLGVAGRAVLREAEHLDQDEMFAMTSCEDCDSYVASNEELKEDEVGAYSVQSLGVAGRAVQSLTEAEHLGQDEEQVSLKRWRVQGSSNTKNQRVRQHMEELCANPALSSSQRTEGVLRLWNSHCRVAFTKFDLLLTGLKIALPETLCKLPLVGKTVMKTPKEKVKTDDIPPGKYYHIGLVRILLLIISILPVGCLTLSLLFNVDGIKPFDSSNLELYPILMSLPCIPSLKHKVFPIGIWCGVGKPKSPELFFKRLEEELIALLINGLIVDGKFYEIFLLGLACDAPAKCYLMGIKYFNGFSSCTRCVIHGETCGGTRVFLALNSSRRTDKGFRDHTDSDYRPFGREAIFLNVPRVDFASPFFLLESMHLLFIGVTSTLLELWHSGPVHNLDKGNRQTLINNLQAVQCWIPMEFSVRRCQDFNRVVWWKAVDFRTFALYLGAVVLKNVLPTAKYNHFLLFHMAVRILHCPTYCNKPEYREEARKLLREFVEKTPQLYSQSLMTHNFHNLLHIVDDADYFSELIPNFSLSSVSAFMFENYLQYLISLPESGHLCLEQIAKRLEEQLANDYFKENYLTNSYTRVMMYDGIHREGPVPVFCSDPQYKRIVFPDFTVDVNREADNCVILTSGQIMIVENILCRNLASGLTEHVITGKIFLDIVPFYPQSLTTNTTGVLKGSKLSDRLIFPASKIKCKCFRLQWNKDFVFFPLLHSEQLESQIPC